MERLRIMTSDRLSH